MLLELADHAPLLQLVDLDHRGQELEVIAGVPSQHLQGGDVLRKTGAPISDPGAQERRSDPLVEAHPAGDLADVGADLLADVGDLVDEGDLRRQEGVGGELDHLGAGHIGAHERRFQGRVERRHCVARPATVVADDDAVGVQEVLDGRALLEELRAGDVAERTLAVLAKDAL